MSARATWEVFGGVSPIRMKSGKMALAIVVLRFLSERDARAFAREDGGKVFRVEPNGTRAELKVRRQAIAPGAASEEPSR